MTENKAQIDAIRNLQRANMVPNSVQAAGAGKGYQSVAQSAAIAVQDGADYLRNLRLISTTAIGAAASQMVATGNLEYGNVIKKAQSVMTYGNKQFATIGQKAAKALEDYPP